MMSTEFIRQVAAPDVEIASLTHGDLLDAIGRGIKRRWLREQRRRKVGRAYDMALEIAHVVPRGSEVLDVGCGNGFIAHHLSAILGEKITGIDVMAKTWAPINYRQYDGAHIPFADNSVDTVLLCYVLHHVQDVSVLLADVKRVLRPNGLAVIYEDIPKTPWDRFICWTHNLQWQRRAGVCTFRKESEWRSLFESSAFEVVQTRQLARLRNLTHPVCRRFYLLTRGDHFARVGNPPRT